MKLIKTILAGLALLFGCSAAFAQSTARIRYHELKIGDKVPDYTLINMINYPTATAKISDFKGKMLIIDFWSTHCTSCVQSWPRLLELQKEFGDKIQILLFNKYENEEIVRRAIKKRREIADVNMTLPMVCRDTMITRLFPFAGVPHIVWIDAEGVVASIPFSDYSNKKNIAAYLRGEAIKLPQESGKGLRYFQGRRPIFVNGNTGVADTVIDFLLLTKGNPDLTHATVFQKQNKGSIITCSSCSITTLYAMAYGNAKMTTGRVEALPVNNIVWETGKGLSHSVDLTNKLPSDKIFNYQRISPTATITKLQSMVQDDLNKYFGLATRWERRKVDHQDVDILIISDHHDTN